MQSIANQILASWYALLNGNLNVPVYRSDAPSDATDYVVIRIESETDKPNNSLSIINPVIITEVVTRQGSGELIDDTAAHDIDNSINTLLYSSKVHNLISSVQIVNVQSRDKTFIPEDDGSYRYYRIVTRYYHVITY